MKRKDFFLIVSLILAGIVFQYFDSGEISFIKGCNIEKITLKDKKFPNKFKEIISIPEGIKKLSLINPAGSIEVVPSNDNTVTIEIDKIVYHKNKQRAKELHNLIKINKINGDKTTIRVLPNDDEFPFDRVRVFFKLYIPVNISLDLRNRVGDIAVKGMEGPISINEKFGNISLNDIKSSVTIFSRFGDVNIKKILGQVELDTKFSKVNISNFKSLDCRIGHSSMYLKDSMKEERIIIDGSHAKLNLNKINANQIKIKNSHNRISLSEITTEELILLSKNCKIKVNNLSTEICSIKNSYGKVILDDIKGVELNILLSNGNLDITLAEMFKQIYITNSNSDISMKIPLNSNPTLTITAKYGKVINKTKLNIRSVIEKYYSVFTREGDNTEINIKTDYGDIKLSEYDNK